MNDFDDLEERPTKKKKRKTEKVGSKPLILIGLAGLLLLLVIAGILGYREWKVSAARSDGERLRAMWREMQEMESEELLFEMRDGINIGKINADGTIKETPKPKHPKKAEFDNRREVIFKESQKIFDRYPHWKRDESKWGEP